MLEIDPPNNRMSSAEFFSQNNKNTFKADAICYREKNGS